MDDNELFVDTPLVRHRSTKEVVNDWVDHPYTKGLARVAMLGWTVFGGVMAYFLIPQYLHVAELVVTHDKDIAVMQAEGAQRTLLFDEVRKSVRDNADKITALLQQQASRTSQMDEIYRRINRLETRDDDSRSRSP